MIPRPTETAKYLLDMEGDIDLYDVPCVFDMNTEFDTATMTSLFLSNLELTRDQAVQAFGAKAVATAEERAEERYFEPEGRKGDDF